MTLNLAFFFFSSIEKQEPTIKILKVSLLMSLKMIDELKAFKKIHKSEMETEEQ